MACLEHHTGAGSGEADGQDAAVSLLDSCLAAQDSGGVCHHDDGHKGVAVRVPVVHQHIIAPGVRHLASIGNIILMIHVGTYKHRLKSISFIYEWISC